ncbi:response regulator [uncultured Amnibacterium sp.]|uniref:response regulator n=1 Tax=uncultured Amnibacterium sp. TaxID=1631851 RepID=UPI0035C99701
MTAGDVTGDPTVVLIDDHPVFRHGLAALLTEDGARVVGSAGSATEGLALVQRHRPDVVVMDLHLPDRSGVEATRQVLVAAPESRVLVLTMDSADATVVAALRAGARGYLLKEAAAETIGAAIRTVLHGDLVLGARFAARLPALLTPPTGVSDGSIRGLSPREVQIVELIAAGCSNAEIGRRLFLAEKTVRNNVTAILAKTGATDRAGLRRLADTNAPTT